MCFNSHQKKILRSFKIIISIFFTCLKKLRRPKLRNLKLRNSGVAITGTGVFLPEKGKGFPEHDSGSYISV
jgi:hypothetical protein